MGALANSAVASHCSSFREDFLSPGNLGREEASECSDIKRKVESEMKSPAVTFLLFPLKM